MFALALAAQLAIVAHSADTVRVCQPLDVSVAVSAGAGLAPQVGAPAFGPFQVMRAGPLPVPAGSAPGPQGIIHEYGYVLVSPRPGAFTIPPFEARLGAGRARSAPLRVVVVPGREGDDPAVIARARLETGNGESPIRLVPDTVYVGQQATYAVAVYLNADARNRLRRNPTFYPPDMQAVLAYDLPAGAGAQRDAGGGPCFSALVYRRAMFPLGAGRVVIPPAQVTYALPVSSSFFSREESHELQTDSVVLVAIEPPTTGRPADYDGAVGRLTVSTRLAATTGRVGDPLVLTARVTGQGNVKLLPAPRLALSWATAVPADERVRVDTTGAQIGGTKEFDWILTPRVAGEQDVPSLRYAYFDPMARTYGVARSAPVHVRIAAGTLASADTAGREPLPDIRESYTGPVPAPWSSHPVFWVLLALVPLPAVRARWRARRQRSRSRIQPPVVLLQEVARAPADARSVRRAYVSTLEQRLGVDARALATPGALTRAAARAGASAPVAWEAERVLRALDDAAYGAGHASVPELAHAALEAAQQLDVEALPRAELPFRGALLGCLVLLAAGGALRAALPDAAAAAFAQGVHAYQNGNFAAARADFTRVTVAQPRAADGWANLGTAAWAAHDTVGAVFGWRRSLGLQPWAGDARERLSQVHGIPFMAPGYVPPVPLNAVLFLMAACWCAAWLLWHPRVARLTPSVRRWPLALGVAAAALGVAAIALGERLSGQDTAVVTAITMLRTDPALGADRGATVLAGEMVRVLTQSGAWTRIQLSDGRQGWVPVAAAIPLDAPAPPALD